MKRYLIFAGWNYYPVGGWKDFVTGFSNLKEAQNCIRELPPNKSYDWVQLVDAKTMKILKEEERKN